MRIANSFSAEEVEFLDDVLTSLSARSVAGGQKLAALAKDGRCRTLADRFERALKRAATGEKPVYRRIPRETVDGIIADYFAGMTMRAIGQKRGVHNTYVSKVVRGLIRRKK